MKPRGRSRYVADVKIRDFWNLYHKENKKTIMDIKYKGYKDIIDEFNIHQKKEFLRTGKVHLPNMGDIVVNKNKMKMLKKDGKISANIDWKQTKEFHKIIFNLNNHSRGMSYKIKWNPYSTPIINKAFYKFIPCRTINREFAKLILNGKDYVV